MDIEVTSPKPSELSMISERWEYPAQGLDSGGPGGRSWGAQIGPGERVLPQKGRTLLEPRDLIRLTIAGGGGFGPPEERDPQAVLEDLRNEIISEEAAHTVYGLPRGNGL